MPFSNKCPRRFGSDFTPYRCSVRSSRLQAGRVTEARGPPEGAQLPRPRDTLRTTFPLLAADRPCGRTERMQRKRLACRRVSTVERNGSEGERAVPCGLASSARAEGSGAEKTAAALWSREAP